MFPHSDVPHNSHLCSKFSTPSYEPLLTHVKPFYNISLGLSHWMTDVLECKSTPTLFLQTLLWRIFKHFCSVSANHSWMPITLRWLVLSYLPETDSLSICQIDRIERLYFAQSDRIDLKDETRVSATAKEAEEWNQQHRSKAGMWIPPEMHMLI